MKKKSKSKGEKPRSSRTASRGILDLIFNKGENQIHPTGNLTAGDSSLVLFRAKGRMSNFGGPKDTGMKPDEGLALFSSSDLNNPVHKHLFLDKAPSGTSGMGRRLNPAGHYIACRWDYKATPVSMLRTAEVIVTNPANGKSLTARPVDWGPHEKTGRIADLSPGLEEALGLKTDDICEVVLALDSKVSAPKATPVAEGEPLPPLVLATGALIAPRIHSCSEWGAAAAKRTQFARSRAVGIVIHHTEGKNRAPLKGKQEIAAAYATARSIQSSHMKGNGWADTGQHFTISQGGIIMEGRHGSLAAASNGECVQAAHAGDTAKNETWFGIEICGDNRKSYQVTSEQWSALVDLCAWLCDCRGGEDLQIIGHKEVHSTSCPGFLMDHLVELRAAVSARRHMSSDVPDRESMIQTFAKIFGKKGVGASGATRGATVRGARAAGDRGAYIAARFIWHYHLDPTVQKDFDPDSADWQERMGSLRMEHTLLTALPGTPPDIAAARLKTVAVTLLGICLHPRAENGTLRKGVSRTKAVEAFIAIMSNPRKSVGDLGKAVDGAVSFP